VRKLKTAKNHRKPRKFKMDNLKKEGFRIRSAPFRANLTADRIWLANFLCCAIGVQQHAGNVVCTSIFLSAFIMVGAKLLFLLFGILVIFHCSTLVIECICYELLLTVYLAVSHSVRVRTIHVPSPGSLKKNLKWSYDQNYYWLEIRMSKMVIWLKFCWLENQKSKMVISLKILLTRNSKDQSGYRTKITID
jgi:hypothetical protein